MNSNQSGKQAHLHIRCQACVHFQQVKLSGLRMALRILLKYLSMMSLLCMPILPPWMYLSSPALQTVSLYCSQGSLIISLISLNIILLDLFRISKIS